MAGQVHFGFIPRVLNVSIQLWLFCSGCNAKGYDFVVGSYLLNIMMIC